MTKNIYILLVFMSLQLMVQAQDFHFTQFYNTPFEMNPARTGIFDGDHRAIGIYRNQWNSVSIPYRSYAVAYDTRANSRLGGGLSLLNDDAGDGTLRTLKADLALSYIFNLADDSVNFISLGVRNGITQNSVDFSQFTFDNQFDGDGFIPGSPTGESFGASKFSYYDLSAGINWLHRFDQDGPYVQGGLALFHINQPGRTFYSADEKLNTRFVTQINGRWPVSERTSLLPTIMYMKQGPFSEINGGSLVRYRWTETALVDNGLYLGAFLRAGDAVNIATGFDYKNFTTGLSYDINISGLETASNNKGGFELSVIYIIRKVKPVNPFKAACPVY